MLALLGEDSDVSAADVVGGFAIGGAHGLVNLLFWRLGPMRRSVVLGDDHLLVRRGKKTVHTVPCREIVLAKLHPHEIRPINLWLGGHLEELPRLTIYCRDGRRIRTGPLFIRERAEGQEIQSALDTYVRGTRRT